MAVQWKEPTVLFRGFIAFTLAGGIEKQSRYAHRTRDAIHDENSVVLLEQSGAANGTRAFGNRTCDRRTGSSPLRQVSSGRSRTLGSTSGNGHDTSATSACRRR